MKRIKLPISTTFAMSIDMQNITEDNIKVVDGQKVIHFGTFEPAKHNDDISTIHSNGAQVLYAATSIEKKVESIILVYFFGQVLGINKERDFFSYELLQSSALTFSFKKELLQKIVSNKKLLKGKRKNSLQLNMKNIIEWRNAFAHGKVNHDNNIGFKLAYYSSSHKTIELNDPYWIQVEKCFKDTEQLLTDVENTLFQDAMKNNLKKG